MAGARIASLCAMASQDRFEDLPVWQAAADLYGFAEGLLGQPELAASAGWRAQLDRAALSVSSQIAHATERDSAAERYAAAGQARAAVAEVRSMLRVLERHKLPREVQVPVARLKALAESCARQLHDWSKTLQETPPASLTPIMARPPKEGVQPRMGAGDMRRRTVEVARKILGILPNHQA